MTATNNKETGNTNYHIPVLLHESIEGLNIKADGIYVDCTFGGGGHSKLILSKLGKKGKLFVFDQDADAAKNIPSNEERITFIPQNFKHLQRFLRLHNVTEVDGILADLGVSSHQFDEAARGFSFRFDADLDMRMDQRQLNTAANVLKKFTEQQLHKIFELYGEVTNAKTLAKTIVEHRKIKPIQTINDFKTAIESIVKGNPQKYWAQVFQALRIEVNDELGALKDLLVQALAILKKDSGRLAIITFHSLEDRLVKNFLKNGSFEIVEDVHNMFGTKHESPFNMIVKKPIVATATEMKLNGRSRSAKLRVAEKR
jgi:16S rRNA (cytosine1402-N4)-methyltransferase